MTDIFKKGLIETENVILVASGKGGVGKSTVSANIAAALESAGDKVLVIDCDIEMCNLDLIFGVRCVFDIQDICCGRCTMRKAVNEVDGHSGIDFIAAPSSLKMPSSELYAFIGEFIAENRKKYDYIIADCPAGADRSLEKLFSRRVRMIVVATPDITSVRDAERVAAIAAKKGVNDVRLVVNRIDPSMIRRRLAPDIDDIIDGTSVRLLGLIPDDKRVTACANKGTLVYDLHRSKSKKAFENISLRIKGNNPELYRFW